MEHVSQSHPLIGVQSRGLQGYIQITVQRQRAPRDRESGQSNISGTLPEAGTCVLWTGAGEARHRLVINPEMSAGVGGRESVEA
ncbi:unnamed protein product [Boreogadus saida]